MFLTIVAFIFVLGILIIAHESGHFLAAKLAGVKVLEFSIGFPPRIASFKRKETQYTIGLFPLGGYVQMLGESELAAGKNGLEGPSKDPRAYNNQTPGKRFIIGVAGVVLNIVLAWLILTIGFGIGMTPIASSPDQIPGQKLKEEVIVVETLSGSAAAKSGIEAGDVLLDAEQNGQKTEFKSAESLSSFTKSHLGQTVNFEIKRDGAVITKQVTISENKESPLGVALADQAVVKVPWYRAPVVAFTETFKMIGYMFDFLRGFFAQLFSTGHVSDQVGGPVAIFNMSGMAARAGAMVFFQFIAMLSVNLALVNILPFPALDGGRVIFILLEKIFGKRIVKEEVENIIHMVGFALLILLILAITYKDVLRLMYK